MNQAVQTNPETNGHDVPMSQPQPTQTTTQPKPLPINRHLNPDDLGTVLKISYRLFGSSPLRHKRFNLADADEIQKAQNFLKNNNARMEERNGKWMLVDKGQVDYMVVSYLKGE
jgi:hypothetical protein